jgi:hypothetical protein
MNKTLYVNFEFNAKEIYFYTVFKYRSKTDSHLRSKFKYILLIMHRILENCTIRPFDDQSKIKVKSFS